MNNMGNSRFDNCIIIRGETEIRGSKGGRVADDFVVGLFHVFFSPLYEGCTDPRSCCVIVLRSHQANDSRDRFVVAEELEDMSSECAGRTSQ